MGLFKDRWPGRKAGTIVLKCRSCGHKNYPKDPALAKELLKHLDFLEARCERCGSPVRYEKGG